jgi:hypothetical protein
LGNESSGPQTGTRNATDDNKADFAKLPKMEMNNSSHPLVAKQIKKQDRLKRLSFSSEADSSVPVPTVTDPELGTHT